jgi:hypothetical protein
MHVASEDLIGLLLAILLVEPGDLNRPHLFSPL